MDPLCLTANWIWASEWTETAKDTAGKFVHFRKSFTVSESIPKPLNILISADTKYKLYINSRLVSIGPVKGDQHMWFYDELDIEPFLKPGENTIAVKVLRFYYATSFAVSFPRLPYPGLFLKHRNSDLASICAIETDSTWEAAIDDSARLVVNQNEDDFLHVYENIDNEIPLDLKWLQAELLQFPQLFGLTPPWKLSPRLIPSTKLQPSQFKAVHNLRSSVSRTDWEDFLLPTDGQLKSLCFRAGTKHHIELELAYHTTAYLAFRFQRPDTAGSKMNVTYSECYEDEPTHVPYVRRKGDRRDMSKLLIGPKDTYVFGGKVRSNATADLQYSLTSKVDETFAPFHFRTCRFITVDLDVSKDSDLTLKGIDLTSTNYPLNVQATFELEANKDAQIYRNLWDTSIRTLTNCLHDCYEDCPFYEQLQYAMDTRSSILFTYSCSHDDRLARQAIVQLHNSYQPSLGLTASRAPCHQLQIIPHFSLFWICTIRDHFDYFGDVDFVRQFLATCDGILETFARLIDPQTGLVRSLPSSNHWDFVDWTETWRPYGVPPAGARTGYLSYSSMLYAYTLAHAASLARGLDRSGLAEEYEKRAKSLVRAVKDHCFDGEFFTDGLVQGADKSRDYSQNSQIWAVLCGAATGNVATNILTKSLNIDAKATANGDNRPTAYEFAPVSVAMSFYKLRALSLVGGSLYEEAFPDFWEPWKVQLGNNLTTWEEDSVSRRSDCHAWGCAPIYDFMAEVAGVRPGAPGWSTLLFQPRIKLFNEFTATVPFGGTQGQGVARVKWRRLDDGHTTEVSLSLEKGAQQPVLDGVPPAVKVVLPGVETEILHGEVNIVRIVKV